MEKGRGIGKGLGHSQKGAKSCVVREGRFYTDNKTSGERAVGRGGLDFGESVYSAVVRLRSGGIDQISRDRTKVRVYESTTDVVVLVFWFC
jgi:hypothetical protein